MAPSSEDTSRSDTYGQAGWRVPLLNTALSLTAIFGSLWLALRMIGTPDPSLLPRRFIGMGLLALVGAAAVFRRLPESLRLAALLISYFGVATLATVLNGPVTLGVLLPLTLFLLLAMLYGDLRGAFAALAAIMGLYALAAYGWTTGVLPLNAVTERDDLRDPFVWLRAAAGQLVASGALVAIVYYVMAYGKRAMTVRDQAEQALRESEDRAQLLIEHAPEAIVVLNMETQHFVVTNPAAERLFGYTHAELLTKSPGDVSPERLPDGRLSQDAAAANLVAATQGLPITFEWTVVDKQGHAKLCEVRLLRLPAADRVLIRGSIVDVTERKQLEEALRERMALLRATLSAAPVGIARLHEGVFLEVSEAFARMLGYRPEELVGRSARMLYSSDDDYKVGGRLFELPDTPDVTSMETRLPKKDGRPVDVAANAVWLDKGRRDAGVVIAVMDITERNQLQDQLRQSQKLEAIGTLAGGIAHDFNNILTGILGFTALSRQQSGSNEELGHYLDYIDRAGRRAADLVAGILAFSRTSGPAQLPLQLEAVVAEVVQLLRATLPTSIGIHLQVPAKLPAVRGNASQLHQVVLNLGTNAAQAMRNLPGELDIRLNEREIDSTQARLLNIDSGLYVCLTVTDTGCGMDTATLERAFEPFYTTKAPGEGTGLGLSVIHGIIRSHGGAIRLRSQVGHGTTAEVFLPALALDFLTEPPSDETVKRGHGEHILFLDDEEHLVSLGVRMLQRLGYTVEGESDAPNALKRFESAPDDFQLIMTDQTMPVLNGLEFASRIHAIRPDLPVLLTSGYSAALTPEALRRAGVLHVLQKPYTLENLAAMVHDLLLH